MVFCKQGWALILGTVPVASTDLMQVAQPLHATAEPWKLIVAWWVWIQRIRCILHWRIVAVDGGENVAGIACWHVRAKTRPYRNFVTTDRIVLGMQNSKNTRVANFDSLNVLVRWICDMEHVGECSGVGQSGCRVNAPCLALATMSVTHDACRQH
jgi:hypothetical protein